MNTVELLTENEIEIYKFTCKKEEKESLERAQTTVKKHINSGIFKKLLHKKVHESEINITKVENNLRGIWKVEIRRSTDYIHKTQKEFSVVDDNITEVTVFSPNKENNISYKLNSDNKVQFDVEEKGTAEVKVELFSELAEIKIDKFWQKYFETHQNKIKPYEQILKRKDKWCDISCENLLSACKAQDILKLIHNSLYNEIYDKPDLDYLRLSSNLIEKKIILYLVPVLTINCEVNGKHQSIDVDAITGDVLKRPEKLVISDEAKELVIDGGAEIAGSVAPGLGSLVRFVGNKLKNK